VKVASTKLTNPEWDRLQDRCNEQGMSIAEHLRNLIRVDLDEEETSPPADNIGSESSEPNNVNGVGGI